MENIQRRIFTAVLDNCSAHRIDYATYKKYNPILIPPNLSSVIEPEDATIGSSFNCAFLRLLFGNLLKYVEKNKELAKEEHKPFKMMRCLQLMMLYA